MNINLKATIITMATGLIYVVSGYIIGHATAMHQHASAAEQSKVLRKKDESISYGKYICEAFKDYKRMMDDPLGLNKELN